MFASLSTSTQASVHRQLALHGPARILDARAVELAGDAPDALFDARLGLAADAVGLGEEAAARSELAQATSYIEGRTDWWRQRVRLLWVRTEISLLTEDPTVFFTISHFAPVGKPAPPMPRKFAPLSASMMPAAPF